MKNLLLLSAALLAGTAFAEVDKGAPTHETKADDLHSLMKSIGREFKTVAKTVDDESRIEANRAALKKLAGLAERCAAFVPEKAKKAPEADREKFVADYKAEIAKLADTFRKIDAALAEKNLVAAKAAVTEANSLKKEDHRKFIEKKK